MNIRSPLSVAAAVAALMALPITLCAQSSLISDNFDSYDVGVFGHNTPWPSAIPGTIPPLTWTTNIPSGSNAGGTQSIVSGASKGRSGSLFRYQENASGQTVTYSTIGESGGFGLDQWQISLDFNLETITPVTSSSFGLLAIGNGDLTVTANQMVSIGVSRQGASATGNLSFNYYHGGGSSFFYSSAAPGSTVAVDQWYTLTITGDNATRTFIISIEGGDFSFTTAPLTFAGTAENFSAIALGDFTPNAWPAGGGRNNVIYVDNFSVTQIPEPSTLALIPAAFFVLGMCRRANRA